MTAGPGAHPAGAVVDALRRRFLAHPRHGPLPALLLGLTVVSGVVDAVSILRMGRVFVANMTGNIAFVGFGLAGARGFSATAALTALAGFVAGAAATGWFPPSWRVDRARLLWTAVAVKLVLSLPVVVVAATDGITPGRPVTYLLIVLLAASMGVQNATVRRLGVPDITTTVLTTTITGLFSDLRGHGWRRPANTYRLASVVCLFGGAAAGAALVIGVGPGAALGLGAALLAAVGAVAARASAARPAWTAYDEA